jgi:hypothetical protein
VGDAPRAGNDVRTQRTAELERRGAHAAGGTGHEQPLTRLEATLGHERVMGGGERLGEPARLGHRHVRGDL